MSTEICWSIQWNWLGEKACRQSAWLCMFRKRQLDACLDWKAFGEDLSGSEIPDFDIEQYQEEYVKADEDSKDDTFLGRSFLAALAIFAGVFGFVLKEQILYLISTAKASSTAGSCVSFLHFAGQRLFISSRYEKTLAGLCSSMYNKQEKQRRFERKRVSLRAPFCAIRPESGRRARTSGHSTANGHRSGSAARCAYRAG